jgi:hypothetical protein
MDRQCGVDQDLPLRSRLGLEKGNVPEFSVNLFSGPRF